MERRKLNNKMLGGIKTRITHRARQCRATKGTAEILNMDRAQDN